MSWLLTRALRDLVLPASCVGCDRPGPPLCERCSSAEAPSVELVRGVQVRAAAPYDGAVRTAIIAYKERDRRDLTPQLGALLSRSVGLARPVLVPVPSARAAARTRGGDHVLRLARLAARTAGGRVEQPLQLCRAVRDSAGLGAMERFVNLDGAMHAAPPTAPLTAPRMSVVVVDDIVTSGATIAEAVRALRTAGWLVSHAAVIAATPRRSGRHADPQLLP